MRKLLIVIPLLIVVLIAIDRAGVLLAEREIGTRVQSAYDLPTRPGVSVHGFPFLTQVASGNYQEIDVSINAAKADGVQVRDIHARFTGVHAPLSLLFGQNSAQRDGHQRDGNRPHPVLAGRAAATGRHHAGRRRQQLAGDGEDAARHHRGHSQARRDQVRASASAPSTSRSTASAPGRSPASSRP